MRRFSEDHTWADIEGNAAVVGITTYAADEIGEINFVEAPDINTVVTQGEPLCVVESSKAASDIFAPLSGTVTQINEKLAANPDLLNTAPETEGWICRIEGFDKQDVDNMMTEEEYEGFVEVNDEVAE
ncbi:MAG: glycine cleavage system protein GcvH [Lentisphaeria bacterium]